MGKIKQEKKKKGWDQQWLSRENKKRKPRNKKKKKKGRERTSRERRKKGVSLISKIYGNRAVSFRQSEKKG